jgi:N-acetylglucosamine kinase-like BadF-type ATPase
VTRLLLGVDGGNTKTVALVVEPDGTILGAGTGGCADIHNATGSDAALAEIAAACLAALEEAGVGPGDIAGAAFSLAGADWPEDFDLLRRSLAEMVDLDSPPEIVNDAVGALRSGTDDGVGVAAVAGTHCAVAGRNRRGELFHLGFWPDTTGAFFLGSEALAAVWRCMLGLGPVTSLTGRALERWNCSDPLELLYALNHRGGPPRLERALFADVVLDEAEAGDAVAREIAVAAGARLGDYARVCAERTGQLGAPFPLVLTGGVFRHRSPLLRRAVLDRLPDGNPVYPAVDPVAGAVLIAADRVGASPDLERLRSTLPAHVVQTVGW